MIAEEQLAPNQWTKFLQEYSSSQLIKSYPLFNFKSAVSLSKLKYAGVLLMAHINWTALNIEWEDEAQLKGVSQTANYL